MITHRSLVPLLFFVSAGQLFHMRAHVLSQALGEELSEPGACDPWGVIALLVAIVCHIEVATLFVQHRHGEVVQVALPLRLKQVFFV